MSRPTSLTSQAVASSKAPSKEASTATSNYASDITRAAIESPSLSAESSVFSVLTAQDKLSKLLGVTVEDIRKKLKERYDLSANEVMESISIPGITISQQRNILQRFLVDEADFSSQSEDEIEIGEEYRERYGGENLDTVLHSNRDDLKNALAEKHQQISEITESLKLIDDTVAEIGEKIQVSESTEAGALIARLEELNRSKHIKNLDLGLLTIEAEELQKSIKNFNEELKRSESESELRDSSSAAATDKSVRRWSDTANVGSSSETVSLESMRSIDDGSKDLKPERKSRARARYFSRFGDDSCPTTHREQELVVETLANSLSECGVKEGETFRVLDVGGGGGRFYQIFSDFYHSHLKKAGIKLEIISYDIVQIDQSYAALLVENGFDRKTDDKTSTSAAIEGSEITKVQRTPKFSPVPSIVSDEEFLRKKDEFVSFGKHPLRERETSIGKVQDLGSFVSASKGMTVSFINGPAIPISRDVSAVSEVTGAVKSFLKYDEETKEPVVHVSMSMFGSLAHIMGSSKRGEMFKMMHDITEGYSCFTMPTVRAHPKVVAESNLRRLITPIKHGRESKNSLGQGRYEPTDADSTTKPAKKFPYMHYVEDQLREEFGSAGFGEVDLRPAAYDSPVHLIGQNEKSKADSELIRIDLEKYQEIVNEGDEEKASKMMRHIMSKSSYVEIRAEGRGIQLHRATAAAAQAASASSASPSSSPKPTSIGEALEAESLMKKGDKGRGVE